MEWAQKELEQIDNEEKQRREELGFKDIYNFKKGENKLLFLPVEKRIVETKYGQKYVLSVEHEGREYDVFMGRVLYHQVLKAIVDGKNPMRILKTGEGKETRYEIL